MNLLKLAQFNATDALLRQTSETEIVTVEPGIEDNDGDITYRIPLEAGYGLSEYTEYGGTSLKIKSKS